MKREKVDQIIEEDLQLEEGETNRYRGGTNTTSYFKNWGAKRITNCYP